jgi:hypothetical protein
MLVCRVSHDTFLNLLSRNSDDVINHSNSVIEASKPRFLSADCIKSQDIEEFDILIGAIYKGHTDPGPCPHL